MEELREFVAVGKALSAPARLKLLAALSVGDLCVTDLTTLVGLRQSAVSKHLAVLRRAGLVEALRAGNRAVYHLLTPATSAFAAAALDGLARARREDPVVRGLCEQAGALVRSYS